ncbi:TRAP transporter large permease [Mycolicibacterium tokaiense]|uniref:TRAP dicarboxylate transporter subunit DctM n=1 Tax=Mycolicibacterium tokaiense TaxID=39695 RepID=A0A378TMX5_9MYCO|nr:TRAP transporter large permease [Mycolicibacterium tokaiense]BBY89475.1 membrane protein [Mycolicibacterium tokaiense]STZ62138.1 TRAP dicarboxylate transporter subunit DctM [Mycolicibacterium tokaiense]
MNPLALLGVFVILLIVGLVLKVPFGVTVGGAALTTLLIAGTDVREVPQVATVALDSFPLLAIPGFVLAGMLMARGGVSAAIVRFAAAFVGHLRGSIGAIAVTASALFGTVCGSSIATIAAVGGFMMPEMDKAGYDRRYSAALIGAAGFIGILIPPSVPGILYAVTAGLSIADVWLSTVAPALALIVLFCIVNYFQSRRAHDRTARPPVAEYVAGIGRASWRVLPALGMPVLIFGGIYGGLFTPTEAAGVTALYGLLVSVFVYRGIKARGLWGLFQSAALMSAILSVLISFASVAGRMVTNLQIPASLSAFVSENIGSPLLFLLITNIVLLLIGMFFETNTSILVLTPIFATVATSMGIEPLHFAAIMLLNLEIGMITPPFAGNLFLSCRLAGVRLDQVVKPLVPFYLAALAVLIVTTLWPTFSMWLPEIVG